MIDEVANHATRVRRALAIHGETEVENFLDICLSIDNLIDYNAPYIRRRPTPSQLAETTGDGLDDVVHTIHETDPRPNLEPHRLPAKPYMDPYINPAEVLEAERRRLQEAEGQKERLPPPPEREVMLFLLEHAPRRNGERDLLGIVRQGAGHRARQ